MSHSTMDAWVLADLRSLDKALDLLALGHAEDLRRKNARELRREKARAVQSPSPRQDAPHGAERLSAIAEPPRAEE